MSDKDHPPDSCAGCGYHLPTKECRAHSPHPGHDEEFVVALWNFTKDTDRCSAGTTTKQWGPCDDCTKWAQPGGKPLNPVYKQGLPDEWWEQSGLCTANAPGATSNEGLWTFWKVTSAYSHKGSIGGCGDGDSVSAALDAATKRQKRVPA